jgi:hypothetical protein
MCECFGQAMQSNIQGLSSNFQYSGNTASIIMEKEPDLPEVPTDDKMLIRNIIYTVMALNRSDHFCSGWQVQCVSKGYMILFFLNPDFAISIHDINMVRDLNSSRICNIVIISPPLNHATGSNETKMAISGHSKTIMRVHVLDCKQPVMHYDADIVRVRKRARLSSSII